MAESRERSLVMALANGKVELAADLILEELGQEARQQVGLAMLSTGIALLTVAGYDAVKLVDLAGKLIRKANEARGV